MGGALPNATQSFGQAVSYRMNAKAGESKYDEQFKQNRFLNQHRNLGYQQKGHIPTYNYRDIKAVGNQDLMLPNIFERQNSPTGNSNTSPTSPGSHGDQNNELNMTSGLSEMKKRNSQMQISQYKDKKEKGGIGLNLPNPNFGARNNSLQPTGSVIKGMTFYNNLNKNINNFKREAQQNSPK